MGLIIAEAPRYVKRRSSALVSATSEAFSRECSAREVAFHQTYALDTRLQV